MAAARDFVSVHDGRPRWRIIDIYSVFSLPVAPLSRIPPSQQRGISGIYEINDA
jgi:hypothetical protein